LGVENSKRCVFCDGEDKTVTRLFLHCRVISKVWREVMSWLNFNFITPPNLFIHAICWFSEVRSKKLRRGALIIWNAVVWRVRNDHIFYNKVSGVEEMVDRVKVLSWQWSLNRLKIVTCLLYEWCWNPRFCLGG